MVSNKMYFYCPSPLPTSSNIFKAKEALLNTDDSQKSTKSSTKHCNSKNFRRLQNVLFFFANLSQGNFLHCSRLFILTKNLNTETEPVTLNFFSSRFSLVMSSY